MANVSLHVLGPYVLLHRSGNFELNVQQTLELYYWGMFIVIVIIIYWTMNVERERAIEFFELRHKSEMENKVNVLFFFWKYFNKRLSSFILVKFYTKYINILYFI